LTFTLTKEVLPHVVGQDGPPLAGDQDAQELLQPRSRGRWRLLLRQRPPPGCRGPRCAARKSGRLSSALDTDTGPGRAEMLAVREARVEGERVSVVVDGPAAVRRPGDGEGWRHPGLPRGPPRQVLRGLLHDLRDPRPHGRLLPRGEGGGEGEERCGPHVTSPGRPPGSPPRTAS
jgi:hypothetical protein